MKKMYKPINKNCYCCKGKGYYEVPETRGGGYFTVYHKYRCECTKRLRFKFTINGTKGMWYDNHQHLDDKYVKPYDRSW